MGNELSAAGYASRMRQIEAYYGVDIGGFWTHSRFNDSRRAFLKDKACALISFDRGCRRNATRKGCHHA